MKSTSKKFFISTLIFSMILGFAAVSGAVDWSGASVTREESAAMHKTIEDMQDELIAVMLEGVKYDTISYSSGNADQTQIDYVAWNDPTEPDRKAAKFAYAKAAAESLGFPVVVQRAPASVVYAEFGDPDAPEMVMALSHLDSPPASVSTSNMPLWVKSPWTPYIKDGWMYGCGLQDDSGPTLATLFGAKGVMENGFAIDRRIRVVMGGYEDNSPRRPSVKDGVLATTAEGGMTASFYDNWLYLHRWQEEAPIGSFTSDSRFPVIVGNTTSWNASFYKDLTADDGEDFSLLATQLDVTHRDGDDTIKDIITGSGVQIASRAVFTLRIPQAATGGSTSTADKARMEFQAKFNLAVVSCGWQVEDFKYNYTTVSSDTNPYGVKHAIITIDTGIAMEAPTPMYGGNAYVRMMYGLANALPNGLVLKEAAQDLASFFVVDGKEDTRGYGLGMGGTDPETGYEMITCALGYQPFATSNPYQESTKRLRAYMYTRSLWPTAEEVSAKWTAYRDSFVNKGWTAISASQPSSTSLPTMYAPLNSPLVKTYFEAYQHAMETAGFDDNKEIYQGATPLGTTGGTLASDYYGKMIAYGAVIPGNERWWHAANERMTVNSAVQMTKMYTDGFLATARYPGPAGAMYLKADFPGYDTTKSYMLHMDVTIGTYENAAANVPATALGDNYLAAATKFNIPVFRTQHTSTIRTDRIAMGHTGSSQIYLDPSTITTPLLLPMRLEMKLTKEGTGLNDEAWQEVLAADLPRLMEIFKFNALINGQAVALTAPAGDAAKYFFKRTSQYSNALYLSAFIALADDVSTSVSLVTADSQMATFANGNNRVVDAPVVNRGFFLIGDGAQDAEFTSPTAIFVTIDGEFVDGVPVASDIILDGIAAGGTMELEPGDTFQIGFTTVPADAATPIPTYLTSDGEVATVSASGLVTAVGEGTATITVTATTIDGQTIVKTFTVSVPASTPDTTGGGSSSGCSTFGFGSLMIFGMLPLLRLRKK